MLLTTLKTSGEFKRVRGGARWSSPAFVLEGKMRPAAEATGGGPRFGFTITKKLGKAVIRNRIRRRFKAIVRGLDPAMTRDTYDYVVVARAEALAHPYATIEDEFRRALAKIARSDGGRRDARSPGTAQRNADPLRTPQHMTPQQDEPAASRG